MNFKSTIYKRKSKKPYVHIIKLKSGRTIKSISHTPVSTIYASAISRHPKWQLKNSTYVKRDIVEQEKINDNTNIATNIATKENCLGRGPLGPQWD